MKPKKAVVVHSGGMDSSICLKLAIEEFGVEAVLSVTFAYQQRHTTEIIQAMKICQQWGVEQEIIEINYLKKITHNALLDNNLAIEHLPNQPPNTLVVGRNGLFVHLAGVYAHERQAHCIYTGIMELEGANSGYRDCSRHYMDLQEQILRIDTNNLLFEIRTPLVYLTKKQTLEKAYELGVLPYLLKETISCYEGKKQPGCQVCPACILRAQGLKEFKASHPSISVV